MWHFDYRTVEQHCQERRRDAAMHRLLKDARSSEVRMGLWAPAWLWVRSRLVVWLGHIPPLGRRRRVGARVHPRTDAPRPASMPRSTRDHDPTVGVKGLP